MSVLQIFLLSIYIFIIGNFLLIHLSSLANLTGKYVMIPEQSVSQLPGNELWESTVVRSNGV